MKFSILTPTFKRADKLMRAVQSVQAQTYQDWEMIIVNDSPTDEEYGSFAQSIHDPRIHYHTNDTNSGVNFSRNKALEKLSTDSKWVIFLDDDDYLEPDALKKMSDLILLHRDQEWFVTNRAKADGTPLTSIKIPDSTYSYIWSYLILKRCRGDMTHTISTSSLRTIRFPHRVKQGEEWFFFYRLGLKHRMFYHNHDSTITDGYDTAIGLNFRKRTRGDQFQTIAALLYEGFQIGVAHHPTFLLYIFLRLVRILTSPNS